MSEGHIRRILINNFASFQDEFVLDLTVNQEKPGAFIGIFGSNGTGKTLLLQMLSSVNELRQEFEVPPQSEINCGSDSGVYQNGVTSAQNHNSSNIPSKDFTTPDSMFILKTIKNRDSIFVAQTKTTSGETVFYGIYAREDIDRWSWSENIGSIAFMYLKGTGDLFVACSGSSQGSEGKTLYKIGISKDLTIKHIKGKIKSCLETLDGLPVNKLPIDLCRLLPSKVCGADILEDITGKNNFPEEIIKGLTGCVLFDNPMAEFSNFKAKKKLCELSQKCKKANVQILMICYREPLFRSKEICLLIRLWQNTSNQVQAKVFKQEVLQEDLKRLFENEQRVVDEMFDALSYSAHVLVEGKVDEHVINALIQEIIEAQETSNVRENYLGEKDSTEFSRFQCILHNTKIISVEGKGNFYRWVESFKLGLAPCIVCDGDAIVGGSAKDMEGYFPKDGQPAQRDESDIPKPDTGILWNEKDAQDNKRSLLASVYDNIESGDHAAVLQTAFTMLWEKLCDNRQRNYSLEHMMDEIRSSQSPLEEAWQFCEKILHVFGWKVGTCDIESALLLSNLSQSKQARLKNILKREDSAKKIIKDIVNTKDSQNRELTRLLTFLDTIMLSLARRSNDFHCNN